MFPGSYGLARIAEKFVLYFLTHTTPDIAWRSGVRIAYFQYPVNHHKIMSKFIWLRKFPLSSLFS
uniref:Uncharacterized protein n=1 Tax=Candidatus Kentrum sp. SD TaxID=2126332 RepID=A0A451BHI9_9GAMM|nr:MAG: hypothetical protein BECKSD772F_GA0070984_100937 [Candidatus Kentron sp. SD]VFK45606.1 MAG: hypothetical protein BECKSD772E_GA0070983_10576 [Candidatus Kentron sp. SD]VFK77752.1 MAG: hypothetical protein BECKSD772D_GA0070982_100181 [Candidatus Kentron sp. SD]